MDCVTVGLTGTAERNVSCRPGRSRLLIASISILLASCGCKSKPPALSQSETAGHSAWFEEVAVEVGLDVMLDSGHRENHYFPEISFGGVGLCDFDGDGFLDVYFLQGRNLAPGATPQHFNQLYHNNGDGTFSDVTESAGVGDGGYGMGCTCGDYDNDGDVDLYVTNVETNVLYRNNGDGTFTDVSEAAGVRGSSWSTGSAFVDFDGDGDLDLFVVNYINWSADRELACVSAGGLPDYCSPNNYNSPASDTLFRNDGNGVFTDVSESAGLDRTFGNGLGIACADYNGDGRVDFYVANDGMRNQLWVNQGGGRFTEEALVSGCAVNIHGVAEAGMGVTGVDIENDGDVDLFMSHLRTESNTFYLNTNGVFEDTTAMTGLGASSLFSTGFGLGFADFDHDGVLDLYVANGRVMRYDPPLSKEDPYAEANQLFVRGPTGRFEEFEPQGGTHETILRTSRAAALGDIDNDGDVDIIVVNRDAPASVLRNVVGVRGHWVTLRVLNRHGSDALGAMVRIETDGAVQWRTIQPAYGYCSSNDPRVHCGLGKTLKVSSVMVRWPGGAEETFGPFVADEMHTLREGTGRRRPE